MAKSNNSGEGKTLVATYPIFYRSHLYEIGESLPLDDQAMVKAWLECKSAKWSDDSTESKPETAKPEAKADEATPEAKETKATRRKKE